MLHAVSRSTFTPRKPVECYILDTATGSETPCNPQDKLDLDDVHGSFQAFGAQPIEAKVMPSLTPEFRQFIGSAAWGKQKEFHHPTDEQLEKGTFQVPVQDGLYGAISQSHLDFLNIGHNTDSFNALDPEIKSFAQEVAERRGTFAEIQAKGEQGKYAAIHMSNVNSAQRHLISTLLGPAGVALTQFNEELSKQLPECKDSLVSLGIRTGSGDMVSGDVYAVTPREYMGAPINGISGKPIARVSVDFSTGDAYLWPQEAVNPQG